MNVTTRHNRLLLYPWPLAWAVILALTTAPAAAAADGPVDLPPRPQAPGIIEIEPIDADGLIADLPTVEFADDQTPRSWLSACPTGGEVAEQVASALAEGDRDRWEQLDGSFQPLAPEHLIEQTWPDWKDAINLRALGDNRPNITSTHITVIRNDRERIVRICHGAAGINVHAHVWLNGTVAPHGGFARLEPGLYIMVVRANHGRRSHWIPWTFAYLAPRLTEVTGQQIEQLHAWRLSQWEKTVQGSKADEAAMLAAIRFKPETIRGKEGFFRIGQSENGRWWLIDPDGNAFYHKAVTGLNAGGMGGRRANRPPVDPDTVEQWLDILREAGFNTLGSWTTPEFFEQGMPFTEIIEGYYVGPWLHGDRYHTGGIPDVWDPRWAENVDAKCRELCTPLRDNRDLVGYFLENERGFREWLRPGERIIARSPTFRPGGPIDEREGLRLAAEPQFDTRGLALLQYCLTLADDTMPAYKRAWQFVLERHGGIEQVGRAWGIELGSRQDLRNLTARGEILISEGYLEDLDAFVRLWVEQHHRIIVEAIRRYDPNHLILGMRHGGTPHPSVLEVEAEWTDVVSRNNYRAEFFEAFDHMYHLQGRPILNGEFGTVTDSFYWVRNPIEPPGGHTPPQRRDLRARDAMDRIFAHPGVVGVSKYRWYGPGADKMWNPRTESPHWEKINGLRWHNHRAVSIAAASNQPPPQTNPAPHGQYFLALHDGVVSVRRLPPATEADEPSERINPSMLMIGLIAREGDWDGTVYGNGIRGRVTDVSSDDGAYTINIEIEARPGLLTGLRGKGEYALQLRPRGTDLIGSFKGTWNQRPVQGRAVGHRHRPLPDPEL